MKTASATAVPRMNRRSANADAPEPGRSTSLGEYPTSGHQILCQLATLGLFERSGNELSVWCPACFLDIHRCLRSAPASRNAAGGALSRPDGLQVNPRQTRSSDQHVLNAGGWVGHEAGPVRCAAVGEVPMPRRRIDPENVRALIRRGEWTDTSTQSQVLDIDAPSAAFS